MKKIIFIIIVFLSVFLCLLSISYNHKKHNLIGSKELIDNQELNQNKVSLKVEKNTPKYVYLTFDDGPSYSITPKLLDLLDEEQVKATFFVINKSDDLDYLIKREYQSGHAIGLHSYSHVYKTIYKSADSYFKDLYLIRNKVLSITGSLSNLVRFPGGSSNTISRNYSRGLMTKLTKEVENRGFYYFDWNISSGDATGRLSQKRIYKNVVNNLRYTNNVILMHDFENNYGTLKALKDIIKYCKDNGYIFKTLNQDIVVHHRILN